VAVNQGRWREAAHESLYKDEPPSQTLENATAALKQFWSRVDDSALGALAEGRFE
jgi:hypothetical protein